MRCSAGKEQEMNIGILGSGKIGGTIGKKWAATGHEIVFGVRDPQAEKVQKLLSEIEGSIRVASLSDASQTSEVILFAVPGTSVPNIASSIGKQLNGKILIDATNQIGAQVMNNLPVLKEYAPDSKLFRAFNHLGWENFEDPKINGEQIDLFYCGEPGEVQTIVDDLIRDVGLNPVYIGGVDQTEVVDSLLKLWFSLVYGQGLGRRVAFKMLRE